MKTLFQKILDGEPYLNIVQQAGGMSKFDIDSAIKSLHEGQIPILGEKMADIVRMHRVESLLVVSCYLYLYLCVARDRGDAEMEKNFYKEVGLKRTQGHRVPHVWEKFGKALSEEPELIGLFVCEALLILAGKTTPQAARDEVLELARRGEKITCKLAHQIRRKHIGPTAKPPQSSIVARETSIMAPTATEPADVPKQSTPKALWTFLGSVVRLVIEPAKSSVSADIEGIIRDMEAALERLRAQYSQSQQKQDVN